MTTLSSPFAARLQNAKKTYGSGEAAVHALRDITVGFRRGGFTAIMGPSGSGKSTLMQCAAGLDSLDSGTVTVGDTNLAKLTSGQLTRLRRDRIGFIFQSFNLLPALSALENILLPLRLAGRTADTAWLEQVVRTVGLEGRLHHRPSELSGGQQQRVAVARAIVTKPDVIFADEPTGNLDTKSSAAVLELLRGAVTYFGQSVVMVTHDPAAAARADKVIFLADGTLSGQLDSPTLQRVTEWLASLEARSQKERA
jgi:putative ABC transport system ATP-binding protein